MKGIFRKAHAVALISAVITCLVVATAATPARTTTISAKKNTVSVTVKDCTTASAAFVARCFQITTSPASAVVVNTGTGKAFTVGTTDRVRVKHTVWVPGLSPNTSYVAQVVAKNKAGKTVKTMAWSSFKTAAPGSAPVTVTSKGNKLLLNGRPWFAEVAGFSSPCLDQQAITGVKSLHATIVEDQNPAGENPAGDKRCTDPDTAKWQDPALFSTWVGKVAAGNFWWVEDSSQEESALRSQKLAALLTWQASDTKPSWKDYSDDPCATTTGFFEAASKLSKTKPVVMGWGIPAFNSPGEKGCTTADLARIKFWTTVAAGGKGVRWFPEDFQNYFDTSAAVQSAISSASSEMAAIGPAVIAGTPVSVNVNEKGYVRAGAWRYDGNVFIVAVNTVRLPVRSTFTIGGNPGAAAQVLWEGRTVRVTSGGISDFFGSQQVHIYKIAQTQK